MAKRADGKTGPVKFTNEALKEMKPERGQKDCLTFDTECRGLGVRATANGTKRFLVQWTDPATKEKRRASLGRWGDITIDQARVAARALLGDVAKGIDPTAERKRRRAEAEREKAELALTFEALVDEWSRLHLVRRSANYRRHAVGAITNAFPHLLKRPAARITRDDAVNGIDKLIAAGKITMAARTQTYARAAFTWAEKRGKVPSNPFSRLPEIEGGNRQRDRVLSRAELTAVWKAAAGLRKPWGAFYQLALLTLQRRDEVAAMRWSQLAPDLSVWDLTVKGGKPNVVHLPETARAILRTIPRVGCDFVFTTSGKWSIKPGSKQKRMLLDAIERDRATAQSADDEPEAVSWWVHDFRRTGVSLMASLGVDPIVADLILSHKPHKLRGVAAVYQRYDFAKERKQALELWAAYITGVDRNEADVVELAERRVRS